MTNPYRSLLVVSSVSWLARDLASAGTIPVGSSMGLDAPDLDGTTALWCSGSFATRMVKTGISHPFLSPGPHWLPTVPREFLRRDVWSGIIGDMPYRGPRYTFYKLAEHKHSGIPAGIRLGRTRFQMDAVAAFGSPQDHFTDLAFVGSEPMEYRHEFRCFIAHGKVTASSFYRANLPGINGSEATVTWDAFEAGDPKLPSSSAAAVFAQEVVDAMGDKQPPGYTLDVGTDAEGNFSVIEANAAWSSNIYHAGPAGVIESVLASQKPEEHIWLWKPDSLFLNRARPLPGGTP